MLRVECQSCGKGIKASEKFFGRTVKCPACKEPLEIPFPDSEGEEEELKPISEESEEKPKLKKKKKKVIKKKAISSKPSVEQEESEESNDDDSGAANPYAAPETEESSPEIDAGPKANLSPKEILFSFKGRIGRQDFWVWSILSNIGIYIIMFVFVFLGTLIHELLPLILILPIYVIALWVTLAISVKRLHDLNKSGWWYLMIFVPIVGPLYIFIVCGFVRGTQGKNKYGLDPLGRPNLSKTRLKKKKKKSSD